MRLKIPNPEYILVAVSAILLVGGGVLTPFFPRLGIWVVVAGLATLCLPLLALLIVLTIEAWRRGR
jgi:hypothetical protein